MASHVPASADLANDSSEDVVEWIELHPENDDFIEGDSALGIDSDLASTTTLDTVMSPVWAYGRGYNKNEKYLLPNDEEERDRLDLQHELFLKTLNRKLHLATIENPHKVLDIGTGTGIWAVEFADEHPESQVIGIDISEIQPEWIPPNLKFQICDVEIPGWNFHDFDFIHSRMLFPCFADPVPIFREAFNSLAPGGIFEIQDLIFPPRSEDGSLAGTSIEEWANKLLRASTSLGKDWACSLKYRNILEDAGFVNIREEHFAWPIGPWPVDTLLKELGRWCREDLLMGLQAISIACLCRSKTEPMSPEEVELLLIEVRKDIRNPMIHAFFPIVVIYGQKPDPFF